MWIATVAPHTHTHVHSRGINSVSEMKIEWTREMGRVASYDTNAKKIRVLIRLTSKVNIAHFSLRVNWIDAMRVASTPLLNGADTDQYKGANKHGRRGNLVGWKYKGRPLGAHVHIVHFAKLYSISDDSSLSIRLSAFDFSRQLQTTRAIYEVCPMPICPGWVCASTMYSRS